MTVRRLHIRIATADDADVLTRLNVATWDAGSSPAPAPREDRHPFEHRPPADHLLAEVDGDVVGYVQLGHPTSLPASAHVIEIQGLGVLPSARGRGIARALMDAALEVARGRGARKVSLRVLASNGAAQALYRSLGFVVEGTLREEFVIDGRPVDDVLMALHLT